MKKNIDYWIKIRKKRWNEHHDITDDQRFRKAFANELLSNKELKEELFKNPEKLIEIEFVITDKKKEVVPFFLNEVQKDFLNKLSKAKKQYEEGRINAKRFIILKGRQQGFTSVITAYQLAHAIIEKNFEGFTLADSTDNARAIFNNKAKFTFSKLPDCLKPTEKLNNVKQLYFSKMNSNWEVATATKDVGRSRTPNFFHGSEVAFWDVPIDDIMTALGQALTKDSTIILESTANGFNSFKDLWDSKTYINCFYEWWRTDEYQLNIESDIKRREMYDVIENGNTWIADRLRLLKKKKLNENQIYWYYDKWLQLKDKIKQEYPCFPEEAFLMSGRPVFNVENILAQIEYLKGKYKRHPYKEGYFKFEWRNPDTEDEIVDSSITFVESHEYNPIQIYYKPEKSAPYVIGGDTKGEGRDFYTGQVLDNRTGERVAKLRMQSKLSKPYTHQMYCLGKYYNEALVGIEINFNTGPIEELTRLHYPKQYIRRKFDNYKKTLEDAYGWKTDGNTRPLIIDKYAELIEYNIDLINDIETLEEALTFIYDDNGRPDAMVGKHDDLIIADMIANQIREQQVFSVKKIKAINPNYTKDMLEDYYKATEEERKQIIERWGEPM